MAVNNVGTGNNAQIKQLLAQLLQQQQQGGGSQIASSGSSPLAGTSLNGSQKACGCPGSCNTCA